MCMCVGGSIIFYLAILLAIDKCLYSMYLLEVVKTGY